MKTLFLHLIIMCTIAVSPFIANAQSKVEIRYAYTMENLRLDKATASRFSPILKAYLNEKKAAGDIYDKVKKKYKAAEKAGTLTDKQSTQLMDAKLESEAKELEVKKKYYVEFKKYLSPKKVYYAFDLAGDKISKIEGRDKE